jgi:hypothetical protein
MKLRHTERGIRMKFMRLWFIACIVLLPALCWAAAGDSEYGYPIPGSYEATIQGTPPSLKPELPEKIPVKQLVLDISPDHKKPDIFDPLSKLPVIFPAWYHGHGVPQ